MKKIAVLLLILFLFASCTIYLTEADILRMTMAKKGLPVTFRFDYTKETVFYYIQTKKTEIVKGKAKRIGNSLWNIEVDMETVFSGQEGDKEYMAMRWLCEYLGFDKEANQ